MTIKEQFKKSFSYTWYLYLIAILLPCVAFPVSYSFLHRPQEYEKLSLFLSVNVSDNKFATSLENKFKDNGVKNVEIVSFDAEDNEFGYYQKLTVVGVNKCDVLILPENKIDRIDVQGSFVELNDDIKNRSNITTENCYLVDGASYGVNVSDSKALKNHNLIKQNTNYYAFLGGKSWNIDSYSTKSVTTSNAFSLLSYLLEK